MVNTIEENFVKIKPKRKHRTTEQFRDELYSKNVNVILLGEYSGYGKKTEFMCRTCNNKWSASPSSILHTKYGCPKCGIKSVSNSSKKSHKKYLQELIEIDSVFDPLEEYRGSRIPIKHKCKVHDIISLVAPTNVLKGIGCKECGKDKTSQKCTITLDNFLIRMNERDDVYYIDGYTSMTTKAKFGCHFGHTWYTKPSVLLTMGHGCSLCAIERNSFNQKMGIDKYKERLSFVNPNLEVVENNYINNMTRLKHKCKICDSVFMAMPCNTLDGHGCKKCANDLASINKTCTHVEFIKKLIDKKINISSIEFLEDYSGVFNPIKTLCKICGFTWNIVPDYILHGNMCGCPNCNHVISKGELIIDKFLRSQNLDYKKHCTYSELRGVNDGLLSYDFFLPESNILIEFQGRQHEKPITYFGGENQFKIQQEHDKRKRLYAKEHNINLLEIWYYDINNIEEILTKELNLKLESRETVIPPIAM